MAYREVLRTFNEADIALVKSLLESEAIPYLAHGENFNMMRPMVEPVRFMVPEDQIGKARDLLSGMRFNYGPLTFHAAEASTDGEP